MSAFISPYRFANSFTTDIDGALHFALENNGTTLFEVSFDKGLTWIGIKPEGVRVFDNASGELYKGELQGRFGDVPPVDAGEEVPAPVNDVLLLKTMFQCNKNN